MKESVVSNENLKKVEAFFQEQAVKLGQGVPMPFKVVDIADGSNVALATAHKAIKELEKRGVLKLIRAASRREAVQYIYKGTIRRSREELEHLVLQLETENKTLKEKLTAYEQGFDTVQVIRVDDSLELIIKRK